MNPHATLAKSVSQIAIGQHRAMQARRDSVKHYEMAEREQQFQLPVRGTLGALPSETTVTILFDHLFIEDAGWRRDSQLTQPVVRFGWSDVQAPGGTIPYAHVTEWNQNDDLDYIGCTVVCGAYAPSIAALGFGTSQTAGFSATLHLTVQGYTVPLDDDTGLLGS